MRVGRGRFAELLWCGVLVTVTGWAHNPRDCRFDSCPPLRRSQVCKAWDVSRVGEPVFNLSRGGR